VVAGSRPDEVNELFSIYLILPAAQGPGVYSASNRNEYQKQKNRPPRPVTGIAKNILFFNNSYLFCVCNGGTEYFL
jgi:hypothetical protein